MSLTPPPLRSGSVPATTVATAGMGGATARPRLRRGVVENQEPLPPHPPAGLARPVWGRVSLGTSRMR